MRDYRIDGLRLDATHAIFDESEPHIMRELADRVRAAHPRALVISEMAIGDRRPIEQWGHDAQWADEFHHALHVLLTGERDGYYEPYGKVADLATAFEETPPERLVVCRAEPRPGRQSRLRRPPAAGGAARSRPPASSSLRRCRCSSWARSTASSAPFQFFTDHDDPAIAEATREGRRREFERFAAFAGEDVPDPQARETFERSKLHPESGDDELRAFYRSLIDTRAWLPREVRDRGRRGG